jgi:hypothetical protein
MDAGQVVRFVKDPRFSEWSKGDTAIVVKTIATYPASQNAIYVLRLQDGTEVWATNNDVVAWNQLSLF